jgi:hypothetical protein
MCICKKKNSPYSPLSRVAQSPAPSSSSSSMSVSDNSETEHALMLERQVS